MNRIFPILTIKRFLNCRLISTRIAADGKDVPKRNFLENRITLIGIDNSVSITDLKNAQNLSIKRELKLVKVQDVDAKTRRPIYKLLTNADYHAEELVKRKEKQANQKSGIKSAKLLSLSCRIGEHDLMTQIKKMIKHLQKDHEVRVVLHADTEKEHSVLENMYSQIEKNVKASGKVLQKRIKGNSIKFQLLPLETGSAQMSSDSPASNDVKTSDKGPK